MGFLFPSNLQALSSRSLHSFKSSSCPIHPSRSLCMKTSRRKKPRKKSRPSDSSSSSQQTSPTLKKESTGNASLKAAKAVTPGRFEGPLAPPAYLADDENGASPSRAIDTDEEPQQSTQIMDEESASVRFKLKELPEIQGVRRRRRRRQADTTTPSSSKTDDLNEVEKRNKELSDLDFLASAMDSPADEGEEGPTSGPAATGLPLPSSSSSLSATPDQTSEKAQKLANNAKALVGSYLARGESEKELMSKIEVDPNYMFRDIPENETNYDLTAAIVGAGKKTKQGFYVLPYLQTGFIVGLLVWLLCIFVYYPGFPLTELEEETRETMKLILGFVYVGHTGLAVWGMREAKKRKQPVAFWGLKIFVVGFLALNELLTNVPLGKNVDVGKASKS